MKRILFFILLLFIFIVGFWQISLPVSTLNKLLSLSFSEKKIQLQWKRLKKGGFYSFSLESPQVYFPKYNFKLKFKEASVFWDWFSLFKGKFIVKGKVLVAKNSFFDFSFIGNNSLLKGSYYFDLGILKEYSLSFPLSKVFLKGNFLFREESCSLNGNLGDKADISSLKFPFLPFSLGKELTTFTFKLKCVKPKKIIIKKLKIITDKLSLNLKGEIFRKKFTGKIELTSNQKVFRMILKKYHQGNDSYLIELTDFYLKKLKFFK